MKATIEEAYNGNDELTEIIINALIINYFVGRLHKQRGDEVPLSTLVKT